MRNIALQPTNNPIHPHTATLLIDLDGTIRERGCKYNTLLMPNVTEGLTAWYNKPGRIIILSNQAGIGAGIICPKRFSASISKINNLLGGIITAFYVATDSGTGESTRRKPSPAMIFEVLKDYDIDKQDCVVVGDSSSDQEAAKAAGIAFTAAQLFFGWGT